MNTELPTPAALCGPRPCCTPNLRDRLLVRDDELQALIVCSQITYTANAGHDDADAIFAAYSACNVKDHRVIDGQSWPSRLCHVLAVLLGDL